MLLDSSPKLEDIIVATLAHSPGLTVEALQSHIASKFRRYSIPALYQELRKLRERTVCVKVGTTYSLRIGWILDLSALTQEMYSSSLHRQGFGEILPSEGKQLSWSFRNLEMLGQFWTQIILKLCEASRDRVCFEYAPHAWFSLSHANEENQFLRAMQLARNSYYLIVGHDSKLSREYARSLKTLAGEISFAEGPFEGELKYYSLIGPYLISVQLEQSLSNRIDRLFSSREPNGMRFMQEGLGLFTEPARIRMTLEHRPKKSARFRRQFTEFFGVVVER